MSLSTSDVTVLAETLAAGKHPKVVFTEAAGQIAGKVGKVVRLEEPAEGDYVVVQFGHDELPFSPAEVRIPARGEFSRKAAVKTVVDTPQDAPPPGAPLLEQSDNSGKASVRTVKESSMSEVEVALPRQADGQQSEAASPAPAPRKKAVKAKPSPELSVTLVWRDNEWSVSAAKGTKVIAKPVPVKASTAVQMVQSLDSPAVAAVVEDIVEQQRQQAADEAEQLRQQLAAAEARLADLN